MHILTLALCVLITLGATSPVRGSSGEPRLKGSVHLGLGMEAGYGGPAYSAAVRREFAGTRSIHYWFGAKADLLPSQRLVLGPCPCTVKALDYFAVAPMIGMSLTSRHFVYDIGVGPHFTRLDWRQVERITLDEQTSTGWHGGLQILLGSSVPLSRRWEIRSDLGLFFLNLEPDVLVPISFSLAHKFP